MLPKEHWIKKLGLLEHPEGGYFKEIFRSEQNVTLPGKTNKSYSAGTEIYYLLGCETVGNFSAWHRLKHLDETWHFLCGSDLSIYILDQHGQLTEKKLGHGEKAELHIHIPENAWFSAAIEGKKESDYALVSCSVFPGFDFENFELAHRENLSMQFPQHAEIITRFTRL